MLEGSQARVLNEFPSDRGVVQSPRAMRASAVVLGLLLASSNLACGAAHETRGAPRVAQHHTHRRRGLPRVRDVRYAAVRPGVRVVVTGDQLLVEDLAPSSLPRRRAALPLSSGELAAALHGDVAPSSTLAAVLGGLRAQASTARAHLVAPAATPWSLLFTLIRAVTTAGYTEVDMLVEQPDGEGAISLAMWRESPPLAVIVGRAGYAAEAFDDTLRPGCATFGDPVVAVPRRADGGYDATGLRTCAARARAASWWRDVGAEARIVNVSVAPDLTAQDFVDAASALYATSPGAADGFTAFAPGLLERDGLSVAREGRDPSEHATPHPAWSTDGDHEIDANAVARVIRSHLPMIRDCYEHALARNPTLAGRVEVFFTVALDGTIRRASAQGPRGFDDVSPCIVRVIQVLPMPRPTGGAVEFSFPFAFTPDG